MAIDLAVDLLATFDEAWLRREINRVNSRLEAIGRRPIPISFRDISKTGKVADQFRRGGGIRNVFTPNATKALDDVRKIEKALAQPITLTEELGKQTGITIKRFAGYTIASRALLGVSSTLSQAAKDAINFNMELTKVAQLRGTSRAALGDLRKDINQLSTQWGVSAEEIIQGAQKIAQSGRSISEVRSILAAVTPGKLGPTFSDINKSIEGLLPLLTQFRLQGSQTTEILDILSAVSKEANVSVDELFTGLKQGGSTFASSSNLGGLGDPKNIAALQEFVATFATVADTTRQSAATIGTSLRTIVPRLQRPASRKLLADLGVSIEDKGQFVGPFEAIKRIAAFREKLAAESPQSFKLSGLAEAIGGLRQIDRLTVLLREQEKVQQLLTVAKNADGDVSRDAAKAQSELSFSLSQLNQEFRTLFRELGNDGSLQSFARLLVEVARAAVSVADSLRPLIPLIASVAAIRAIPGVISFGRMLPRGFGRYSGSNYNRGGSVDWLASGGRNRYAQTMLTPGEAVFPPDLVKQIGLKNLEKLNKVGIVPGTGNRDTYPAQLPIGSYVVNRKSAQYLGKGGRVSKDELLSLLQSLWPPPSSPPSDPPPKPQQLALPYYPPPTRPRTLGADGRHILGGLESKPAPIYTPSPKSGSGPDVIWTARNGQTYTMTDGIIRESRGTSKPGPIIPPNRGFPMGPLPGPAPVLGLPGYTRLKSSAARSYPMGNVSDMPKIVAHHGKFYQLFRGGEWVEVSANEARDLVASKRAQFSGVGTATAAAKARPNRGTGTGGGGGGGGGVRSRNNVIIPPPPSRRPSPQKSLPYRAGQLAKHNLGNLAFAGLIGGGIISQAENPIAKIIGGAISGASSGFMLGMMSANPWVAAGTTVSGLVVGAIISGIEANKDQIKKELDAAILVATRVPTKENLDKVIFGKTGNFVPRNTAKDKVARLRDLPGSLGSQLIFRDLNTYLNKYEEKRLRQDIVGGEQIRIQYEGLAQSVLPRITTDINKNGVENVLKNLTPAEKITLASQSPEFRGSDAQNPSNLDRLIRPMLRSLQQSQKEQDEYTAYINKSQVALTAFAERIQQSNLALNNLAHTINESGTRFDNILAAANLTPNVFRFTPRQNIFSSLEGRSVDEVQNVIGRLTGGRSMALETLTVLRNELPQVLARGNRLDPEKSITLIVSELLSSRGIRGTVSKAVLDSISAQGTEVKTVQDYFNKAFSIQDLIPDELNDALQTFARMADMENQIRENYVNKLNTLFGLEQNNIKQQLGINQQIFENRKEEFSRRFTREAFPMDVATKSVARDLFSILGGPLPANPSDLGRGLMATIGAQDPKTLQAQTKLISALQLLSTDTRELNIAQEQLTQAIREQDSARSIMDQAIEDPRSFNRLLGLGTQVLGGNANMRRPQFLEGINFLEQLRELGPASFESLTGFRGNDRDIQDLINKARAQQFGRVIDRTIDPRSLLRDAAGVNVDNAGRNIGNLQGQAIEAQKQLLEFATRQTKEAGAVLFQNFQDSLNGLQQSTAPLVSSLNNFANTIAGAPELKVTGQVNVQVTMANPSVLEKMEPAIRGMVGQMVNDALLNTINNRQGIPVA